MNNEYIKKEDIETVKSSTSTKKKEGKKLKKSANAFLQILNGEFLVKDYVVNNLGFVFFLFAMFIIVISKGYYGKNLMKEIDKTQTELDAKTAEYVEAKAKLEEITRRDILVEKLNKYGLYETTKPAKVIRIKKEDK
jgi:cell division protein FtsL